MRGCLTALVALVVVIGVVAAGVWYYLKAPEMRPLITYLPSFSWDELKEKIPFLHPAYQAPPPLSPEAERDIEKLRAELEASRQATSQREEQARKELQGTGLPISGIYVLESSKGEPIFSVALDYEKLTSGADPGEMLTQGVESLVRIVDTKAFDLSGMSYLTMAVRDEGGRVLFAVTAKTGDIESYRAGEITRRQFIQATAAQIQSRTAALDFIGKVVPR